MTIFNSGYYLNPRYLEELLHRYRTTYSQASPFPHVVIDQFLPPAVLEQVLEELSALEDCDGLSLSENTGRKTAESSIRGHSVVADQAPSQFPVNTVPTPTGSMTAGLLHQLNSVIFINFLEQLTGSTGLLPNPSIESSGLRAFDRGKPFKVQVDLGRYPQPLDRKLTFLIYLNKNWKEEYGGHLELWNAEMTHCEKKVLPTFNRCVIFSTSDFSYYGHPEPLDCPEHETRKLLALYYYGNPRRAEMMETSFLSSRGKLAKRR